MPILSESSYRAPWYARHNFIMFAWANFFRCVQRPEYSTPDILPTPPGQEDSFIQLVWSKASKFKNAERVVLIAPGLEGGSGSKPICGMVNALNKDGFDVAVWIYRDTGGRFTNQRSTYSGYGLEDLERAVAWLAYGPGSEGSGYTTISLVGLSLGANIVLQYLQQCQLDQGIADDAIPVVDKIVAISPPIDFGASVEYWSQGLMGRLLFSRISVRNMRKKAKAKRAATHGRYPSRADVRAFSKVQSVVEADHLVNTDLNEFSGALEYWSKASTSNVVWPQTPDTRTKLHTRTKPRRIETLVISARDDFLLDAKSYPVADAIDGTIWFDLPANGSHIGFVPRGRNKERYWSEARTVEFLKRDNAFLKRDNADEPITAPGGA